MMFGYGHNRTFHRHVSSYFMKDDHSNKGFVHEGGELHNFLAELENTCVITGDRHWQHCSWDPAT